MLLDGAVEGFDIDGPAELTVESDVEVGWDGGVPPLDFDVDARQVRGAIEKKNPERVEPPGRDQE